MTSFKNEFGAANVASNSAWLVSCYQLGALAGSLLGLPAGFYFGRRWGLLGSGLIFTLGAGIMLAADGERGFAPIYAGRVIAGVGMCVVLVGPRLEQRTDPLLLRVLLSSSQRRNVEPDAPLHL